MQGVPAGAQRPLGPNVAYPPMSVTLALDDHMDISRGDMIDESTNATAGAGVLTEAH